jgi:hypothetical protein
MNYPDTPAFARTMTGAKRTAKVEARVTDDLKFALQRRCHELAMSESDYIDRLVCVSLYGIEHVRSVELSRIEQVCGLSALNKGVRK